MKIPKDVTNLLQELLSRDLEKSDFDKLKISYQKLSPSEIFYTEKYNMLFFQHFSDLALKDTFTREEFIKYIPKGIECSFENDILKSTNDIFQNFIDSGLVTNKEAINIYFKGINKSIRFNDFHQLYELIYQKLSQRDKQFLLAQLLESNIETEDSKIHFGNFLIEEYGTKELTESEKIIIEDIKRLQIQKVERLEKERLEQEEENYNLLAEAEANLGNS